MRISLLILLFTIASCTCYYCVHDEDCYNNECCVNHSCRECNRLKREIQFNNTIINDNDQIINDNDQMINRGNIFRLKRQSGCPGCLGLCMCISSACVCIPID